MPFARARALLAEATATGACSAAAVDVGGLDGARWQEAFGRLSQDPADAPASAETVFDLASLTKVIATTSLVMRLAARDLVGVEAPIGEYLPAWRDASHAAIRVRHLLDHSSGLPGHARLG